MVLSSLRVNQSIHYADTTPKNYEDKTSSHSFTLPTLNLSNVNSSHVSPLPATLPERLHQNDSRLITDSERKMTDTSCLKSLVISSPVRLLHPLPPPRTSTTLLLHHPRLLRPRPRQSVNRNASLDWHDLTLLDLSPCSTHSSNSRWRMKGCVKSC